MTEEVILDSMGQAGSVSGLRHQAFELGRPEDSWNVQEIIDFLEKHNLGYQVRKGVLNLRKYHSGERSLHVGSGKSGLPIAEALLGLDVLVVDLHPEWTDKSFRQEHPDVADAIRTSGGSLHFEMANITVFAQRLQGQFNHITLIDFDPLYRSAALFQFIDNLQLDWDTSSLYRRLSDVLVPRVAPDGNVLIGGRMELKEKFAQRLREKKISFIEHEVGDDVFDNEFLDFFFDLSLFKFPIVIQPIVAPLPASDIRELLSGDYLFRRSAEVRRYFRLATESRFENQGTSRIADYIPLGDYAYRGERVTPERLLDILQQGLQLFPYHVPEMDPGRRYTKRRFDAVANAFEPSGPEYPEENFYAIVFVVFKKTVLGPAAKINLALDEILHMAIYNKATRVFEDLNALLPRRSNDVRLEAAA